MSHRLHDCTIKLSVIRNISPGVQFMRRSVEMYAILAREFSDCVARLGGCAESDPRFIRLAEEAKRRLDACIDAAANLERRWKEKSPVMKA